MVCGLKALSSYQECMAVLLKSQQLEAEVDLNFIDLLLLFRPSKHFDENREK